MSEKITQWLFCGMCLFVFGCSSHHAELKPNPVETKTIQKPASLLLILISKTARFLKHLQFQRVLQNKHAKTGLYL